MSLQSTDQIADLITRIRNAIMVGKTEIRVPTSKLKVAVIEGLINAGYIDSYISKVSKPGRRVYVGSEEIPVVKSGRGIVLLSTSKGIMTGREAKKQHLGGEILVKVY